MVSKFQALVDFSALILEYKDIEKVESSLQIMRALPFIKKKKRKTSFIMYSLPGRLHKPETSRVLNFFSSSATRFPRILEKGRILQQTD